MIACSRDPPRGSAFRFRPTSDALHEPLCDSEQQTRRGAPETFLSFSHDSLIHLDAGLMAPYVIPEDVRRFLLRWIDSVVQLEALLLLRDNAGSEWSLPSVAARLYLEPEEVAPLLTRLCADGFLVVTDAPALAITPAQEHHWPKNTTLENLARLQKGGMITVIVANAVERAGSL